MQASAPRFLCHSVNVAVFLFFALMLAVPRGYTVGAVLLLLGGLYSLAQRPALNLSSESKSVLFWLLAAFAALSFSTLYHGNPLRDVDASSRYLLAVPIFLLFLAVPIKIHWLWAGLIAGCISTAGWTYWETIVRSRAFGHTGAIQFGDLSLMMGVYCAAGFFWALKQGRNRIAWALALGVAALCGFYGSIASGARGGWVALPVIVVIFCIAFVDRKNAKWAMLALAGLVAAAAVTVATVPSVADRYEEAKRDIALYQQGVKTDSIGGRFAMWEAAAQLIKQRPLLGWGRAEYRAEVANLVEQGKVDPHVLRLANVHNNYLEIWVFHGVFGLLAVIGLFVVGFVYAARQLRSPDPDRQAMALCAACLIAGYAIFNLSQNMMERNNTLLFFCVSFVLFQASILRSRSSNDVEARLLE